MHVDYCDLCGQPIKDNQHFVMYATSQEPPIDLGETYNDYYAYLKKIEKEVKEICPTCKIIFDKIFELRLQNLSCLSNELLGIYNLSSINNDKKRKNE
jgi:hypothetical protein